MAIACFCCQAAHAIADESATLRGAVDGHGFIVHTLNSEFQAGRTEIKVLLPDKFEAGHRYRVLYVLPVEAGVEHHYGDGLSEVRRLKLHNRFNLICVAPTFTHLPWYADHPTDQGIRQESYFVKTVVPRVDREYPTLATAEGRWLLGFSKSGWGALSLLSRHPDLIGRVAAWDAPLEMSRFDLYGAAQVFQNQAHFEQFKVLPAMIACEPLKQSPARIVLTGYGNFRDQHQSAHQKLEQAGVKHVYRDGPQLKHSWDSGWIETSVILLADLPPIKESQTATPVTPGKCSEDK